jgi:hypothetical protein
VIGRDAALRRPVGTAKRKLASILAIQGRYQDAVSIVEWLCLFWPHNLEMTALK